MPVPSTLTGLLLFVVLLWPGFVYTSVRDRNRPDRQLSPWRSTVTIATVSLTALAVVFAVFAVLRVLLPGHTPAVHPLFFHPRAYLSAHYVSVTWWAAALLALAVGGAAAVAALRSAEWVARLPGGGLLAGDRVHPSQMSSWWVAFSAYPVEERESHVGCTLDDGSYVSGLLYSYSQLEADSADRDLVLKAPIRVRPAGAAVVTAVDGAGLITVSARHIVTMTVSYVPVGQSSASPPGPAVPPATT